MTQARHAERMVKKIYLCGTSVVKFKWKIPLGTTLGLEDIS
jgi:hypothetical protein